MDLVSFAVVVTVITGNVIVAVSVPFWIVVSVEFCGNIVLVNFAVVVTVVGGNVTVAVFVFF